MRRGSQNRHGRRWVITVFTPQKWELREPDFTGKRVVVVGGGQSGADIVLNALSGHWGEFTELSWISRRLISSRWMRSIFTNEYFTPEYVNYFYTLPEEVREQKSKHKNCPLMASVITRWKTSTSNFITVSTCCISGVTCVCCRTVHWIISCVMRLAISVCRQNTGWKNARNISVRIL